MHREKQLKCSDDLTDYPMLLPERALLWGCLERALADLNFRGHIHRTEIKSAIHWFRTNSGKVTYKFIVAELEISQKLLNRIEELVVKAEHYINEQTNKW